MEQIHSPAELRVVEVDPRSDLRWEAYLASHPRPSVYHHPAWLESLQREYRRPAVHLVCEDSEGRLHGILPLVYTRGLPFNVGSQLTARRLASLPRTPLAGPLFSTTTAKTALTRAAVERVRAEPGVRLQLKVARPELEGAVEGLVGQPWRRRYVLELPETSDALRLGDTDNDRGTIKRAVKKAERLGVTLRPAETVDELRSWYALHLDLMRFNATPPRPYRFFAALWDLLRPSGLMHLLLAEQRQPGAPVLLAGVIMLTYRDTVSAAYIGNRRDCLHARPLDAIHWRAIHDACRQGFRFYDFGEV
ncbi:MAG TPA: GNAT family N-acetyltransferase, partial [Acidimicrobiia bacterium]|nr:GNAT family N-acetyltransferase [Acidimicrobiia bacterium]